MTNKANITDKTVIVTGGNTGLGYECAKTIATSKDNWHVVIACRNNKNAREAVKKLIAETSNEQIEEMTLDLASLTSVRNFAKKFVVRELPPLRAVVCNAAIQIVTGTTYTEDGFETTFAVNHLGHFLLVNLLLKHLVSPARIVFVSSDAHDPEQKTGMPAPNYHDAKFLAWPDKDPPAKKESIATIGRRRYTTSKLCKIFCTYELSRRLQAEGHSTQQNPITVNAFNPGLMPGTGLARTYSPLERFVWSYIMPILPNMNTTRTSGKALARLVLDPELKGVSGKYFTGFKEAISSQESYNQKKALELWETSVELVKLTRVIPNPG